MTRKRNGLELMNNLVWKEEMKEKVLRKSQLIPLLILPLISLLTPLLILLLILSFKLCFYFGLPLFFGLVLVHVLMSLFKTIFLLFLFL